MCSTVLEYEGSARYLDIDELFAIFNERSLEDTKDVKLDAWKKKTLTNNKDLTSLKPPSNETINAYHSTVLTKAGVTQRTAKSKPILREVAETSRRTTQSNACGIIAIRCKVVWPSSQSSQV